jgi:hypothetical protein
MSYLLMRREGDALVPVGREATAALAHLPEGKPLMVKVEHKRNLAQLRQYWAVLERVVMLTKWETKERLHIALKLRLGKYDLLDIGGKLVPVPHSTALDEMTQTEFNAYFEEAMHVIGAEIVPDENMDAFLAEVA